MPSFCSHLSSLMKKPDLFSQTGFLRYNGEGDYRTATGGFISLAVYAIFIILFFNMGIKTLQKEIVTFTVDT